MPGVPLAPTIWDQLEKHKSKEVNISLKEKVLEGSLVGRVGEDTFKKYLRYKIKDTSPCILKIR